jgi:hypothetical protein
MAIKPILFNTEMVRAILDGRKSCTRRNVKSQQLIGMLPDKCKNGAPEEFLKEKKLMFKPYCDMTDIELINTAYKAPYQPGDILYVRETWKKAPNGYYYYEDWQRNDIADVTKWKPSIHMPKEAARIWLKVTDVRVERLQDITEEQACMEGTDPWDEACYENNGWHPTFSDPDSGGDPNMIDGFHKLWNFTIKKSDIDRYGWDANPWVWVIEFERCDKPEEV